MGIKEQTVSVHIRGSYRYRRAPYNRNRRSKRALRFPSLPGFLSFLSFAPSLRCELAYREQEVIMYVFINYAILRVIMRRAAGQVKEIGEQAEEVTELPFPLFEESFGRSEKSFQEQLG